VTAIDDLTVIFEDPFVGGPLDPRSAVVVRADAQIEALASPIPAGLMLAVMALDKLPR
jgi:hypothetical protein